MNLRCSRTRGYFFESFSQREFEQNVRKINFVQDNESKSVYGVMRGLHFQSPSFAQSKLKRELGWEPSLQFEEGIEKTVRWYLDNQEWMDRVTSGEYEKYYEQMYKGR